MSEMLCIELKKPLVYKTSMEYGKSGDSTFERINDQFHQTDLQRASLEALVNMYKEASNHRASCWLRMESLANQTPPRNSGEKGAAEYLSDILSGIKHYERCRELEERLLKTAIERGSFDSIVQYYDTHCRWLESDNDLDID